MNNKLRKKILKEINHILEQQEPEQVEYSDKSTGQSRTTTWGGGAAVGAAAGAAIGTFITPGIGTAIGAAIGGVAGLVTGIATRTAGYQEVKEDIMDAMNSKYLVRGGEVAGKLHTGAYIDLTAMEDSTDLDDFKSFMGAMKQIQNRFDSPKDEKEYGQLYNQLYSQKDFYKKICDIGYFLLNETGPNDRMYYVKCGKLIFKKIPPQPKQGTVKEAADANATNKQPAVTPATTQIPKCTNLEPMLIPVGLIKLATEDEIEDSSTPIRNPVPEDIQAESPFTSQICNPSAAPKSEPETTPGTSPGAKPGAKPVSGGGMKGKAKCVRCVNVQQGCSGKQVEEIQAKLNELGIKVSEKGAFGKETYNAVLNFQKSKGLKKVDGIVGPETCLAMGLTGSSATTKPSATSKFVDVNVKPQDLINLGFTGRFVKRDPAVSDSEMQKVSVDPEILTVLEKGKDYQPLEESKNFYDNIKLKQSRLLYEKLIRKL